MDEPFSAIDPEMKSGLINELRTIFKELGATVLIVSHNPQELEGLANQEMIIS
jgi:molybdate transport system ATP-binding protein